MCDMFCAGQKGWYGCNEIKVGDAGYFRGNVNKVLDISYVMACSKSDEYLDEDYAYTQHEKGLDL